MSRLGIGSHLESDSNLGPGIGPDTESTFEKKTLKIWRNVTWKIKHFFPRVFTLSHKGSLFSGKRCISIIKMAIGLKNREFKRSSVRKPFLKTLKEPDLR